ncbi:MAG: DUF4914 family protein [Verrucomicrobiae bacterium]|nr:DUF4914 family protein [Verrucomicrobiae bacterium]
MTEQSPSLAAERSLPAARGSSPSSAQPWQKFNPPAEAADVLAACPRVTIFNSTAELVIAACNGSKSNTYEVAYEVPGRGRVVEATVAGVRNGICANYTEPYMRRRDPDCMVIGDDLPTEKSTYRQKFGKEFASVRQETFSWLKTQPLAMFGFLAGHSDVGLDSLVIAPSNAGFFALGLAMLQGIVRVEDLPEDFEPRCIIYVAPPFRHTHFDGKQIVVHNRREKLHELFAYNLYPGPSAKKGIYGVLLGLGERENWVTAHCSTVQVVTPYDNVVTFLHEGASGGGKSEMLEQAHREPDGRLLMGENLITKERRFLELPRTCQLLPVTDDMALCHPSHQRDGGRLTVQDAESAWFVRVNHIDRYGVDIHLEGLTAQPPEPLLFLSIDAVPGARAMIWEHIEDAPGQPCPNPRVIIPRAIYPGVINKPVAVDIRSFGVRTPPCTRESPSYGILGFVHLLSPALAWLWRLVAPRGHANPSIVDTGGMTTEGVGSYWPFATGKKVPHANMLLDQFERYTRMRYILCPNQHVGAWKVGFMPQWVAREYLARRGHAQFKQDHLRPSRCPLLGYALHTLHVEGKLIPRWFLQVESQPEVGEESYDKGAAIIREFFEKCLQEFDTPDLAPHGRQIIQCFRDNGSVADYEKLIPSDEVR